LKAKVKSISCGGAHTALLTEAGRLLMVGRGREGQLGREQKDESNSGYTLLVKEVEQLPEKSHISKISCGGSHTIVLIDEHL
jgi:alpha-tubulin suppressor-like RCC1 family protein